MHYIDVDARDAARFEKEALLHRRSHPPVEMEELGRGGEEEDEENENDEGMVDPPLKYESYKSHRPKNDPEGDEGDEDDVSLVHVACLGDGKPQTRLPLRAPAHEMYINAFPLSHYSALLAPYRREHRSQVSAYN